MKKHYKKIILLFMICNPLFFSLFSFNVLGVINEQLSYDFLDEVLIDTNENINFTDSYNVRNPINYTDIYNASYSFTNDTNGIEPLGWTDHSAGTCSSYVVNDFQSREKVLFLDDDNGPNQAKISDYNINDIGFGTIELWWNPIVSGSTYSTSISLWDSGSRFIYIHIFDNDIYASNGGASVLLVPINDNSWTHIRIDFECTIGTYQGLSQYDYYVYVNGIRYGNYNFQSNQPHLDEILLESSSSTLNGGYFDAIGYSWLSNYTISENIFPLYTTDTNITEIDKSTFDMSSENVFNEVGGSYYNEWTEFDDTQNTVNTAIPFQSNLSDTRVVRANYGSSSNNYGIVKTFPITSEKVQVSFSWSFNASTYQTLNSFYFEIYSESIILINQFYLLLTPSLNISIQYFNTITFVEFDFPAILMHDLLELRSFIDYSSDTNLVECYVNNTLVGSQLIPLMYPDKTGIGYIKAITHYSAVGTPDFLTDIHNIGVYDDGVSVSNDFGYISTSTLNTSENWLFNQHNIFEIDVNGVINTTITTSTIKGIESNSINSYNVYNNSGLFKNIYSESGYNISNPILFFYFYGNISNVENIYIDSLDISGSSLNQGINKYWLEYSSGNVDIDDNYFYVDSINRLQYNLTTNDNNTEYIQAIFDINDISSTNRFLGFSANLFGLATGTFRVQFLATSNIIPLDRLDRSYNEIITQELTIDKFVLLITDDDTLYTENTIGNFRSIKLRYSTVETTVITLMLVGMLIPLIIILIPSIGISNVYGRNLTVPLVLLMSVICVVSFLIPTWLFFIIGFNSLLFIFSKKDDLLEGV